MYDHVLVPTDGSRETEQAVSHGLGLARTFDATVHALYVTDEDEFGTVPTAEAREQLPSAAEEVGRPATAAIVERAGALDLDADPELRQGTPYAEIRAVVEVETAIRRGSRRANSSSTPMRTASTYSDWAHTGRRARSIW